MAGVGKRVVMDVLQVIETLKETDGFFGQTDGEGALICVLNEFIPGLVEDENNLIWRLFGLDRSNDFVQRGAGITIAKFLQANDSLGLVVTAFND